MTALREPWRSLRRQREGVALGMWAFLGSEAMLFSALILALIAGRYLHGAAFAAASRETDIVYGTANTAILLTSSLTMAIAAEAAEAKLRRLALWGLAATLALGLGFLALKGLEWAEDIERHLWPGVGFALEAPASRLFFALYWIMTALHAVHVLAGLCLIAVMMVRLARRPATLESPALEATALYWHLVDCVWIFLFPLLYLGGRAG
ncbi:MAG: cytochrome [Rubritepida sp.]|nr:cytochrome [Rubritepida sp.]